MTDINSLFYVLALLKNNSISKPSLGNLIEVGINKRFLKKQIHQIIHF